MSGIAGIWNLDGQPVDRGILRSMSDALGHRGPDGQGEWISGSAGLACRLMRIVPQAGQEVQPLCRSRAVLVFDGRLDNREELSDLVGGLSPGDSDAAVALAAYRLFGERFASRLVGDFALGIFDEARRALVLARDPIGLRPLFYARWGNALAFASEIKPLLPLPGIPARPNEGRLAAFLAGSDGAGGEAETFFQGVYRILPGHQLVATATGVSSLKYWDFNPARRVRFQRSAEYALELRRLLTQAVERRLRSSGPVAVSVSGGLDSSSIFCIASRRSGVVGITSVAPERPHLDETAFIEEIEGSLGVSIARFVEQPSGFLSGAGEALYTAEAPILMTPPEATSSFFRAVRKLGCRVLLTGHWGDQVLFDPAYLVDMFRSFSWRTMFKHLREFGRWNQDVAPRTFERLFFEDLVRPLVPRVFRPIIRRIKRLGATPLLFTDAFRNRAPGGGPRPLPGTAHSNSIFRTLRSWYYLVMMEAGSHAAAREGLEVAYPFLDRDLVRFLLGVPGEAANPEGVPKGLLREAMKGTVPDAVLSRRWKADASDEVNETITREWPDIAGYLDAHRRARRMGYTQNRSMPRAEVRGPGCARAWDILRAVGLEIWLDEFFPERITHA